MKKKSSTQAAVSKIKAAGTFRQGHQKIGQPGMQPNLKGRSGGSIQRQHARRDGMR
jgi:hypothetical protein